MSDIEQRINNLEVTYGVKKAEEINTFEEFLNYYPDFRELEAYFKDILFRVWNSCRGKHSGDDGGIKAMVEAGHIIKQSPGYLNDMRLQRAIVCLDLYEKLRPDREEAEREQQELLNRFGIEAKNTPPKNEY